MLHQIVYCVILPYIMFPCMLYKLVSGLRCSSSKGNVHAWRILKFYLKSHSIVTLNTCATQNSVQFWVRALERAPQ